MTDAAPDGAVPIPSERRERRRSRVVQSSLDLVFSYSRSQQMRYGKLHGSAPSFVDASGSGSEAGSGSPMDHEDATDGPQVEERRESGSSGLFTYDTFVHPSIDSPRRASPDRQDPPPAPSTRHVAYSPTEGVAPESAPLLGRSRRRSSARRRSSSARRRSSARLLVGDSTDGQTVSPAETLLMQLFNAVAVLVGIGLLSLPLAFGYAGWAGGSLLLIAAASLTCYTAKLLARLILHHPTMRGYTDIGREALGPWAGGAINMLFCLELFALGVALVVLFGDSLNVLYPSISADAFKVAGFLIILPTTLLPLRLLSLPSLLSTLSSFLLVGIILVDGVSRPHAPGSIREPAAVHAWPMLHTGSARADWDWLGAVGLILAGFGGHAVVPSLARDMRNPHRFDRVIVAAFIIATAISLVAGTAGYLMMGDGVSDEITRDLMRPEYGYPRWLNTFALWMIVVNPVTKFGLCSRPLNTTLESLLGLSTSLVHPVLVDTEDACPVTPTTAKPSSVEPHGISEISTGPLLDPNPHHKPSVSLAPAAYAAHVQVERRKRVARYGLRVLVTALVVAAAVYIPGFERVMAFLGSFSAFLICVILPLVFYIRLAPRLGIEEHTSSAARTAQWLAVGLCSVLMVSGTAWAFLPKSEAG